MRGAREFAGLGHALITETAARDEVLVAASVLTGPAVLLGSAQYAGRAVDLAACAAAGVEVVRRRTAGTAMYVDGDAIGLTIALPRVNAVIEDATLRTLVNRNIRGVLKGLTTAGALAHYFGREWIAVKHRPIAVIGTTFTDAGAVLLEIVIANAATIEIPTALSTAREQSVDRWRGKSPITLVEALGRAVDPERVATRVIDGFVERAGRSFDTVNDIAVRSCDAVTASNDPLGDDFGTADSERCEIGFVDVAWSRDGSTLWCGGDAWAPREVLETIGAAIRDQRVDELVIEDGALEGARVDDFVRCAARTKPAR